MRTRQGEIMFGGIEGLDAIQADRLEPNRAQAPVFITRFLKFNREVSMDSSISELSGIELAHDDYVFSFEAASLDFSNPLKNQYAYRLEGFNDEWIYLGAKRDVTFTNLDPGRYKLIIKASNSDGYWTQTPAKLNIVVRPPYWATWWFRLLMAMFFGLILYAVYQWRVRFIRFRNRELQAAVTERTKELREAQEELIHNERLAVLGKLTAIVGHELRNPLGTIKSSIFSLRERISTPDQKVSKVFDRIDRNVTRCDNIIEELLDFTRAPKLSLQATEIDTWIGSILSDIKCIQSIEIEKRFGVGSEVWLDQEKFRRCIINIVQNACDALSEVNDSARIRKNQHRDGPGRLPCTSMHIRHWSRHSAKGT